MLFANHSRFRLAVIVSFLLCLGFAVPAKAQTLSRDWFQLFNLWLDAPNLPPGSIEQNIASAQRQCEDFEYTCVLYEFLNTSGQTRLVMIAQRPPEPNCGTMPWLSHCSAPDDNNHCSTATPNPQTDYPIVLASGKKYLVEQDARTARPDGVAFSRSYNYRPSPQNPASSYRKLWSLGPEQDRIDFSLHEIAYSKVPLAIAEIGAMPEGLVRAVYRPYDYLLVYLHNRPFYVRMNLYTGVTQIPDPQAGFLIEKENPTPEQGDINAVFRVRLHSGETYLFNALTGRILRKIAIDEQSIVYTYTPSGHGPDNITMTDAFGHQMFLTYGSDSYAILKDAAGQETHYLFDSATQTNPRLKVIYPDDTPHTLGDNPVREYEHISAYDAQAKPTVLNGALRAVYDNGQLSIRYEYDPVTGMPIREEKAGEVGRADIAYTLNTQNKVTQAQVTNSLGRTTTYHFSSIAGRQLLTRVDGQDSCQCAPQTQNLSYDTNGYLASKTDLNGNITRYTHDAQGRELQRIEAYGTPQQRVITTDWHPVFELPTRITEPGRVTEHSYNAKGNRLSETVTDAQTGEARTTRYTYNAHGQVLSIDGSRTDVTDVSLFEYDVQGNRIRITNALGQVTEIPEHDPHGNPLTIIDPNGVVTTLAYDARQRLLSRTAAAGTPEAATTRFEYDRVGNLTKITLPNGAFLRYRYDAAQRLHDIEDNFGNRIEYTLDSAGNRTAEQTYDPDGNLVKTQSAVFDSLSRLLQSIGANNQITRYGYDANGNQTRITDPKNQTTVQAFDALNRLINITDSALGKTEYRYNALDQLTQVKDPKGLATDYVYNAFGEVLEQRSPDTGLTRYQYDAAGNQISKSDARGISVHYRYDALNRLTDIQYPDASENIRYQYDQGVNGIGRLSRIEDQSGVIQYRYDVRGNVIEVMQEIDLGDSLRGFTTQYRYDAADHIIEMTYPSGRLVRYTRDPLGRIARVDSAGRILAEHIDYLPFGPLKSLRYGNGLTETRRYDLDYRITGIEVPGVHNLSYGYDPNSNIEKILDSANPAQSQSFGYDALDRLIDAAGGYGTLGYTYDPIGNRLQEIQTTDAYMDVGGRIESGTEIESTEHTEIYQYGTQSHQLLQRGSVNYQYDAVGNTIHNGTQAFIFNQMNRLSRVEQEGEQIAEYRYNALGQRTLKTTGSVDTTDYLALAEEQEALAAQHRNDAQAKQDQAAALDESAEDLTEQAAQNETEATILRNEAIQDRLEADALEAEAVPLEAEAQPWIERADRFRARIVEPPQNRRDEIRNAVFSAVASIFQGIADVYLNEAAELRTEAQALRDGADQKEQQAATLEAEAAQLLVDTQQAREQAAQLRSEAEALIALAEAAESLAAEYRELAENPPNVQITTLFVYNQGGLLIGEYTEQGATIKEYVYLNGQPLALLDDQDEVYYYHVDHLGTPKTLTDQNQLTAWQAEYEPFGEVVITMEEVANNLRFPGQYFDSETGLHYNYFRDYDPRTGRYVESDPIGLAGGVNTYVYADANPIKYMDPSGLRTWGLERLLPKSILNYGQSKSIGTLMGEECAKNVPCTADQGGSDGVTIDCVNRLDHRLTTAAYGALSECEKVCREGLEKREDCKKNPLALACTGIEFG